MGCILTPWMEHRAFGSFIVTFRARLYLYEIMSARGSAWRCLRIGKPVYVFMFL